MLADAFGVDGFRPDSADAPRATLARALSHGRPAPIEVPIGAAGAVSGAGRFPQFPARANTGGGSVDDRTS